MSGQIVEINLLERNYRVMCPDGQESALREAARQLDERLNETRSATKLTNIEQIAVMTALNLCHEWMQERAEQSEKMIALEDKVALLQATIKKAIGEPEDKSPSKTTSK
ncbi:MULTISPECIES: cell division protein ZapA [Gammaproteobacteria]|uniref:cell division protein ZapA n=1 Tax=Gammaproteobacteria TaxID=1236 RepID=UPI000DD073C7|nr:MULTISPECIES: cell division protein ZapA [Gammaproteobacteria]RTE85528.1 cell division protein ZapA [Aliidiomarina sp. B3213]TCZ89498.1 cell division protein ZapA [Lysobacter sp. N42]